MPHLNFLRFPSARQVGWLIACTFSATVVAAHGVRAASESASDRSTLEVLVPLLLAATLFALGLLRLRRRSGSLSRLELSRMAFFCGGCLALGVALLSSIDTLSAELFSIHMIQHEVLMLIAAPLLVLGHPLPLFLWAFPSGARKRIAALTRLRWVDRTWTILTLPLSGWLLHAAALWGWHAPALFEAALEHPVVHDIQHVSFLLTALLFWNGLLRSRLATTQGVAVLYLFTTTVHSGVLGALITCASHPWFAHYRETAPDWGLTALEDQQLGGLIMWVPASLVYVGAALFLLARWIRSSGRADAAGSAWSG